MAGRGKPPKDKAERRNRTEPERGDWTDLRAPDRAKAPKLPARGKDRGAWSPRTRGAWTSWWRDPVSTLWGEADRDLVLHLADVYEEWVRQGTASLASETRQLRDNLGLSPKGRQDRRWRVVQAEVVDIDDKREPGGTTEPAKRRLRAVDPGEG